MRQTNFEAIGLKQFGEEPVTLFSGVLNGTATIDPASLADGAGATAQVTVPGAAIGDYVLVAAPYDLVDLTVTAYVQAANTVEIRIQNESGATADLASGVWKVKVLKG
jgi:hypothetical protein